MGLWDAVPDSDLPYADFLLPLGAGVDAGHAIPVNVGDEVWVDFPLCGDPRFPRITGSIYHAPNFKSNLPSELFGGGFTQKRHADEPPATPFSIKDDLYSRFGLIEQKTQAGGWCITQKATGTAIEITKDGGIVLHSEAGAYRSSTGDTVENVGGALKVKIAGNALLETEGEYTVKAGGGIAFEAGGAFSVKATNADFKLG